MKKASPHIGTLNEKPLHEALKKWYARPHDRFEVPVDGSVADIVRGKQIIEIQTKNFAAIRRKLEKLLAKHKVRLVYPIAAEKWIVRDSPKAKIMRRLSPKRGDYLDIFNELLRIPHLIAHPNFSLELVLIKEEESRVYDGKRGWRRGYWVIEERRLLEVMESKTVKSAKGLEAFLPKDLPCPFTTTDLAKALQKNPFFARKMAYCLKRAGCIQQVGKKGNFLLYKKQN